MIGAKPVRAWVVSDGRRGIEAQALGLAEAIGRRLPLDIEPFVAPKPRLLDRVLGPSSVVVAPFDLWIGCGRAAVAIAPVHKRARPEALFVYVQDPKRAYTVFDVIVAPAHDQLDARRLRPDARLVTLIGSPNRLTPERLAHAARSPDFAARLAALPAPRLAVLVGGASKRHDLGGAVARDLLDQLDALSTGGASLMISTSRRTSPAFVAALSARFEQRPGVWLWRSEADGPNPYFAFLAGCDGAIVTQDSTNMLTEAASAGKPVLIARASGRDGKFVRLYDALIASGRARWFEGRLELWQVEPLAETDVASDAVVRTLAERGRPA